MRYFLNILKLLYSINNINLSVNLSYDRTGFFYKKSLFQGTKSPVCTLEERSGGFENGIRALFIGKFYSNQLF